MGNTQKGVSDVADETPTSAGMSESHKAQELAASGKHLQTLKRIGVYLLLGFATIFIVAIFIKPGVGLGLIGSVIWLAVAAAVARFVWRGDDCELSREE